MKSIVVAALLACGIASAYAEGQSAPPGPTPLDARIIAENDSVVIFRMSIPPHAKTPMHDVTPLAVVWLSDAHFVDRYPDGRAIEENRNAGEAEWVAARRHSGENLSDRPMEFIAVVPKIVGGKQETAPRHGH